MTQPSANEQYMLELINAERAKAGAQPLAFDFNLLTAAENHSRWMIGSDTFSHTGAGGSNPTARMTSAGYEFAGSWASGENIAWASTRAPDGLQDEVQLLHTNLMNSPDHRANILNANFREIGIGFETGEYQGWNGAFVTQDFARSGSGSLLTGVAFGDKDKDKFYDPGEGLGSIAVKAVAASGAIYTTTTMATGGYQLDLPTGHYTVTFSGGGVATIARNVTIGSTNVKLDLINPATTGTTPAPSTSTPVLGTSGNDKIAGTASSDTIGGLGGSDFLSGLAGNDHLDGGIGNDLLNGGTGKDLLIGGAGRDAFLFNSKLSTLTNVDTIKDFSVADDTIRLENAIFTKLTTAGPLSSGAFYKGTAAHDANDRVLYNSSTGASSYDADGNGSGAAVKFAQLAKGLGMTHADFLII